MKRILTLLVATACAGAISLNAAEKAPKGQKPESKPEAKAAAKPETAGSQAKAEQQKPTPEQRQFMKEMAAKYDLNGDKKLDKEERAKITAEDRAKMRQMAPGQQKREGQGGPGKKDGKPEQQKGKKRNR